MAKKYSEEEIELRIKKCVKLRKTGITQREIADKLGFTRCQVNYYLNKKSMIKQVSEWKKTNKKKVHESYKRYRNKLKSKYYNNLKCIICGDSDIVFHHTDVNNKLFKPIDAITYPNKYTEEEIKAEIAKCVPVCKKHHNAIHFGTLENYKDYWNGPIRKLIKNKNGKITGVVHMYE